MKVFIEDVNDNAPVFNQTYVFNVTSSVAVGTEVGRVMATDADMSTQNSIVLYFIDGGGYGKFQIDSQTGKLQMLMSNELYVTELGSVKLSHNTALFFMNSTRTMKIILYKLHAVSKQSRTSNNERLIINKRRKGVF